MHFFGIILLWTLLWLIWNTLAPSALRFDPYPAFALWVFLCNMLQMLLMPLLMIEQNLDARNAETRAEAHFVANIKVEQEIECILMHLDYHNQLLRDLMDQHETQHKEFMYHINQLNDRETLVIASLRNDDTSFNCSFTESPSMTGEQTLVFPIPYKTTERTSPQSVY